MLLYGLPKYSFCMIEIKVDLLRKSRIANIQNIIFILYDWIGRDKYRKNGEVFRGCSSVRRLLDFFM